MGLCTIDDWHQYVYINVPIVIEPNFIPHWNFVVALLTQVFYCYRIAVFTKSKYAVAAIVMVQDKLLSAVLSSLPGLYLSQLSVLELGASIATAMQTRAARFLPDILKTKTSLITIGI